MSDEDALLAAIAAQPDEDTPRLVFADWLDENGQHIRAEFIRVQIDISQKELLPRGEQDAHVEVWKRNQELIENHRREILGPARWLTGWRALEFRRGFVAEIQTEPREFWANRLSFAAMQPLPRIVVVGGPYAIREFLGFDSHDPRPDLQAPIVSAIRTNGSLLDNDTPYPERLTDPRVWSRLSELDISGLRLGNDHALALLQAKTLPALVDLDVSSNDLSDEAIAPFLQSGLPRQLKRLILGGNPLSNVGAQRLAELWPRGADDHLAELNLRFTNIGSTGQQALLSRFGGKVSLF